MYKGRTPLVEIPKHLLIEPDKLSYSKSHAHFKMCNRQPRTGERLNYVIGQFLNRHQLFDPDPGWEIRKSSVSGFGVFVTRDFDVDEVIFRDFPVILGPRCVPGCPRVCVACYSKSNLHPCGKGCGLEICSLECQETPSHLKECKIIRQYGPEEVDGEIFENLTPIRSLFLGSDDKEVVSCLVAHDRQGHGREIDTLKQKLGVRFKSDEEEYMRFVCQVLDANAFEVTLGNKDCQSSLRGLYPLGSLANHSCVPNIAHVFDDRQRMVAKAAIFIPKNSEIFHSYTRIIWGTTTRLYHLHQTKHFVCKCERCRDPTEFGTYMGSVLCKLCRGIVSPVNPHKVLARWQCQDCKNVTGGRDTCELTTLLGSILKNTRNDDFPFMYNFLNGKLKSVVPEDNQVAVELKYKIVWILGHKTGYKWTELTTDQLEIKKQICINLLDLAEKLRCGHSKMRGLLLYELFYCERELINRAMKCKQNNSVPENVQLLLKEAASILEYDVTAPEEIKMVLAKSPTFKSKLHAQNKC